MILKMTLPKKQVRVIQNYGGFVPLVAPVVVLSAMFSLHGTCIGGNNDASYSRGVAPGFSI